MNVIDLLKSDNETVDGLFKSFESAKKSESEGEKHRIVERICQELDVHAAVEEELLRPSRDRNVAIGTLAGFDPEELRGAIVNGMEAFGRANQLGSDGACWKGNGIASIDGVLYLSVSRHWYHVEAYDSRQIARHASLLKSADRGKTWTPAPRDAEPLPDPLFPGPRFATASGTTATLSTRPGPPRGPSRSRPRLLGVLLRLPGGRGPPGVAARQTGARGVLPDPEPAVRVRAHGHELPRPAPALPARRVALPAARPGDLERPDERLGLLRVGDAMGAGGSLATGAGRAKASTTPASRPSS